jgi:hypothetical protein
MTRESTLKELDQLSRRVKSGPVSEREVLCQEMRCALNAGSAIASVSGPFALKCSPGSMSCDGGNESGANQRRL